MTLSLAILLVLPALAGLYLISVIVMAIILTRKFIYPRTYSLDYALQDGLDSGEFTKEEIKNYKLQKFSLESDFAYTLRGVYSQGDDSHKTVILVHGHSWNWYGQLKYFSVYRDMGFNIMTYNHRYHGDSDGPDCSGGYFEKYDLQKVATEAMKLFPETEILGLMGESLGAATVLQTLPLLDTLSFVHADCPYSDLFELFEYQLSLRNVPHLFRKAVVNTGRIYIKIKAGYDIIEVSPRQALKATETPTFLVHGEADDFVPTSMSVSMKESRPDNTELILIPGAVHAKSMKTDPEKYKSELRKFLEKIEN